MLEPRIKAPDELKDILRIENCSDFNIDRLYLTDCMIEIYQAIVDNMSVTEEMQALGMDYMNSTLLYGPPGTGKTNLARWIAYSLDMDFVFIDYSQMKLGIFGSATDNLHQIFEFMMDKEAIFMLDELDYIAVKRGTESDATGGELSRMTITLMQELDYYNRNHAKNILLAGTNRVDLVDPALRSRFSIEKEVKRLTNSEKQEYIIQFLQNVGDNGIEYDLENIKDYCALTSTIPTRNVERDISRCMVQWIKNGKKNFMLNSIR